MHSPLKLFHTSLVTTETPAERTFRGLLQYPSTSDGASVFESLESDDYLTSKRALDHSGDFPSANPSRRAHNTPCSPLRRLIRRERYGDAQVLFRELKESEISLFPSMLYIKMAKYAVQCSLDTLSSGGATRHDPVADIEAWMSFIPPRAPRPIFKTRLDNLPGSREAYHVLQVQQLGHFFMRFSRVPSEIIVCYALAAARKGYGRDIYSAITHHLARILPQAQLTQFLNDFYAAMVMSGYPQSDTMRNWIRRVLWSSAIRARNTAGRVEDALNLLHQARAAGIHPTSYTYGYLYEALKHHECSEAAAEVKALLSHDIPQPAQSNPPVAIKSRKHTLSPSYDFRTNFAIALHILRNGENGDGITRARALVPFFSICRERRSHPVSAIRWLYARAWALGANSLAVVVHAHMLHYISQRRPRSALRLFTRFFHPVGVPEELLYTAIDRRHGRSDKLVITDKFIPSPMLTALVWGSLARTSHSRPQFTAVYEALKRTAADAPRISGKRTNVDGAISAEHFQQFLVPPERLRPYGQAYECARMVLRDMNWLGIEPGWQTYASLAQVHIYGHQLASAQEYFEEAINLCERNLAQAEKDANSAGVVRWKRDRARACALVISAFVKKDMTTDAQAVARRLLRDCGYVKGSDPKVDTALKALEEAVTSSPSTSERNRPQLV